MDYENKVNFIATVYIPKKMFTLSYSFLFHIPFLKPCSFLWAVLNDTLRVDVTNATMECWKKVQEGSKEGNTAAGGHRLQLLYC